MLDANDDMENPDFGRFMDKSDLYEILGTHHSIHSPPTYIGGTRTIDYLLGTKNVVRATQRCGMNHFNDNIISDHRGLWADIDIPELLSGSIPRQQLTNRQPMRSSQTSKMKKIRDKSIRMFQQKNITARLTKLLEDCKTSESETIATQLEKIDQDMDDIMLLSVPQNTPSHPYWWSPEIH